MISKQHRHQPFFTLFAIIWTAVITITSIMPLTSTEQVTLWVHMDKVVHFVFYFVAVVAWLVAGYRAVTVLLALIALGWAIEFIQQLSGWRSGDVYDGLTNMSGGVCGWLLVYGWSRFADKRC